MLENTISHSILDASSTGSRNTSPWDMAVAFNAADSSIGSRQLMSELDYLYKYDANRHAYVGRAPGAEAGSVVEENRPFLIILQSENDQATGEFFPLGTGLYNIVNFRAHWDKVPVPGSNGQKISESEFYDHTPGNNKYLVNYHVVPVGETSAPPGLRANENRAFEANIKENHPDYSFYTSEHTIATRIASAAMATITPMNTAHLPDGKFGEGGNLFIPEMPACRAGSCAYQRR